MKEKCPNQDKNKFEFISETHQYLLDEKPIPSVTQILDAEHFYSDLSLVPDKVMQRAQNYGQALHKACELEDKGILDKKTLSEPLVKPLESWKKFVREYKVSFIEIEVPHYSPTYKFGFTPDRIALVLGKLTIIDIKSTTNVDRVIGLQLGGYQLGYEDVAKVKIKQRLAIKLTEERYEVFPFKDETEKMKFLTLLNAYRIRKEYCNETN